MKRVVSILVVISLVSQSALASGYIWDQKGRNDNPNQLTDIFEAYVKMSVQNSGDSQAAEEMSEIIEGLNSGLDTLDESQETKNETPSNQEDGSSDSSGGDSESNPSTQSQVDASLDQLIASEAFDLTAEELAYLHWNEAVDRRHFNQILIAAITVYKSSFESRDAILKYLLALAKLYEKDERQRATDTFSTKASYNNKVASQVWLALIVGGILVRAAKNKGFVVPKNLSRGFSGWASKSWSKLVPTGSIRARAFEKVALYRRWQAVAVVGGATALAGLSEIVDNISEDLAGERLNPTPLIDLLLASEASQIAKMSCDLATNLEVGRMGSENLLGLTELHEQLSQQYDWIKEIRPRYEFTQTAVTEDLKKTKIEADVIYPGVARLIDQEIRLDNSECNTPNVNWGVIEMNLNKASGLIEKLKSESQDISTQTP